MEPVHAQPTTEEEEAENAALVSSEDSMAVGPEDSEGVGRGWGWGWGRGVIQVKIRRHLLTQLRQLTFHSLIGPSHPPVQQHVIQNCRTGENSGQAMKTLQIQPAVSTDDGNTAVPPVSVPIMAGLHNPSSMAVPSTDMDVQYEPSDMAVQMGTSSMQQHVQDVYWIQPEGLVPRRRLDCLRVPDNE